MGLPPIATFIAVFAVLISGREISGGQQQTPADFDCPEEFGYYAHPTDCTQYYVCVFGGALLESCTGGLMYSHELQTCDWPRNVGCAPGQQQALQQQGHDSRQPLRQEARQDLRQELAARQELRQELASRQELRQEPRHDLRPEYRQVQEVLRQSKQPQQQQQILQQVVDNRGSRQRAQISVPKADLYNTEDEELGPAVEELEIDRQQRVYRGQPSTLGQVASDRDGLTHSNAIPVPATGGRDKLSVVSYGAQQQYNSKTKPIRTDGIVDMDHNFLTNTLRVRMKRDSNSSYLQSPGPQPFQRRTKKHNRKKRQHHHHKTVGMVMAGHKNNNSPNGTDSNGASIKEQDHKEDDDEDEDGEDHEQEDKDEDEEEEEGEDDEEEETDDDNNNEDSEEEEGSEKLVSEEHKNHSKEEDKESTLEKSNEEIESNEKNKTFSSDNFKFDFPKPPSSWESFEDFKGSFDDIDYDLEKFLEELKSDSFDDINMFGSERKIKKSTKSNPHSILVENGLKPATITVPIISGYRPTEVKFELYFPSNVTTEMSLKSDQLSSFLPTTPTTVYEDWKKSLTVPTTSIPYTPIPQFNPSFSDQVSLQRSKPQQENSEIENNNRLQLFINRRSEEYPSNPPHQQQHPGSRSQGQRRLNIWREQPISGERSSLRGQNRGRARYTFETPPYAIVNTTPNYNSNVKPSMNIGSTSTAYGTRNFQQLQPKTRSWLRVNNPKPTGNQPYRFAYATHFSTALQRPENSKENHVQIYETTTPRQTSGRITQLESDPNHEIEFHMQRPENNYNSYERKPQQRHPSYGRERQNLSRHRNRGNTFYRSGGKVENLIGVNNSFQPVIDNNPNNSVTYPAYFTPPSIRHQNQISESNPNFLTNSQPINNPSFLNSQPVVSILNQPVSIPELKNEESQSEEQIYHQNRDEKGSSNTESTFIYDQKLAINNDNGFRKNSSAEDVSFFNNYQLHTSPRSSDMKSPIVVSPIYTVSSSFFMSSTTAIPRPHSRDKINFHNATFVHAHKSEIANPKDSIYFEKVDTTTSNLKLPEEKKPELFNYRFDSNSHKNIKSSHQEFSPKYRDAKLTASKANKTEYHDNHNRLFTNETKNHSMSHKNKDPVSFIYVNQKIGPVQKVAIFRNIPTEDVSNENDDYYNDYDEEDYNDYNNETKTKLPSIPKTLQNIDYQESEDTEYDDYSGEEADYDDGSKNSSNNEMGSEEDDYDEEEDEEDMEEEETNKGDKVEKMGDEGSVERPQIVTPKPGCIFAGRSAKGRKRLLCPRNHLTDKPTTKADDQTNSEQTRRTITLLRASVQQPVQQQQVYDTRGYNTSRYIQQPQQQQQYTDPNYYSVYDEEAEQYKDIGDYAQYIQQNKQDIYTRKKPSVEIVQQEPVQRVATYQKSKYSNQPENIYQSVTPQEYDSYSIQNNDDLYRQVQTKSNNRFPDVKELASTPGERRLTLSAKFDQAQLPTDTSTRTDRVGSGFRLGNTQTDANVINITPRKRGGTDTTANSFPISDRASSFAKEVNALAPSFTENPVSKVLDVLTKSGEYVSDEASIEQSKEVNQVTTERARRVKTPLTVEEIDIAHLKSFNFQSTPASRFRIATTTSETPYIQPVISHNQFSDRENFAPEKKKVLPAQTKTIIPSQIQKFEANDPVRNEQHVSREGNERIEPKLSEANDFRSTLNKEYEQHKQKNAKHYTNNRLRGTFRHHNSGEVIYTDPASEQNYSDQSSSQELPEEWRELSKSKTRDPSKLQQELTTNAPEVMSINKDQPRFRPVTVTGFEGLTTPTPPRKVDSPVPADSISLNGRQQQLSGDFEPVSFADVENGRTSLSNRAEITARTQKPLLIRIPEKLRAREENIRKIEVPRIRDESYNPGKIRVIPDREQLYNEKALVNKMAINPEDSDPTSEEARKPISIRIPDYLPKSQDSRYDHNSYPSGKQHIKPRERSESESKRDKPTPIRYFDSMEYSSQSREDNSRGSNRFRGTSRGTGYSYESEPIELRGLNLRSREHLNSETNQEPSTKLLDELHQTDARQRLSANSSLRSREQQRIEVNQEVARPVAIRVPDAIDISHYQARDESKPPKIADELVNPSKTEEATQRRGEYRSRGRQPETERAPDKSSDITNRFEVATTLRPTNRLIANPTPTKAPISRPPKKYRNGTIYTDQTLPIGTDMTDFPPSAEPDSSIRARPMSNYTPSTPGLTRGSQRHRGSQTFTVAPNEDEPAPVASVATSPPRGTLPPNRGRPTLKPSTTVVGKAAEFVDIYRFPPSRPQNVYPTPQVDKTAAKCRKDVCLLPDCYCGGKDVPGDLTPEETPQIVLLTFDDSVNDLNKGLYSDLFDKGRVNPNGCPISATFYVSHEWTDYSQVQNLYSTGHEIASHSVSHSFGEQFSQKKWTREIAGQREILAAYGGVKLEDIRGMRAPFLAVGGNKMFKMLYDSNFTYDSSMPVYENRPPSWPYTLDYKVFHDCMIPPCPTKSYPGIWEVPMVMWQDLNGGRCSMGDACSNPPNADGVYKMLLKNFERHFTTNRAPFGLFYHAAWFTQPHHKEGFIAFLDTINKMPEVWLITNWQAVQWVRDPTPLSRLGSFAPFQCNYQDRPKKCNNPKVCNLWHKSGVRYMRTCQPCPEIYPWTGKSGVRNSRVDNDLE